MERVSRVGQVWLVNEGGPAELVGLVVSKNEEESGHGSTTWNVLALDGWKSGDVDTWGENDAPHGRAWEAQQGLRRLV